MAMIDHNTTLGDLNDLDRDNFDNLMRNAKTYRFETPKEAQNFMGVCVDKALRKCGVKINPSMDGHRIGRLMTSRQAKVEHRVYDDKEEYDLCNRTGKTPYQTGLYIYSRKEIAAFVSSPFRHNGLVQMPGIYVRTTVPKVMA